MYIKTISKIFPWVVVLVLVGLLWFSRLGKHTPEKLTVENTTILQEVEALGKLELVKYRFQEVIEAEQIAERYLDLGYFYIPGGQDQKAVYIATGEAVACVDLQKIAPADFNITADTIFISMPAPELCYYKIDLEKSRFYDLETSKNKKKAKEFIDEIYTKAEKQIKIAALESGILQDAEGLSNQIVAPFLEKVSGRPVILTYKKHAKINLD
jgi:hypothetical protein